MNIMPDILDIVFILIALFFVVRFAKKGFIRSVLEAVSGIISFVLAFILSGKLSSAVSEKYITPFIENKSIDVVGRIKEIFSNESDALSFLPIEKIAEMAKEEVLIRISGVIARGLLLVLLFLLFLLVFKTITSLINGLFSLPILSGFNMLLGAGIGAFYAVFILFILLTLMMTLMIIYGEVPLVHITKPTIDATHVVKFLWGINPIAKLFV